MKTASEILTIDRVSHEITIETFAMQTPQAGPATKIHGIIGVIRLIACPYLIVITGASTIGHLWDQPILKVENTDIIPFSKTTLHLTEEQAKYNTNYLSMVKSVLNTESFYYSTTYDLTHTLQRLNQPPPGFLTVSMAERADPRFFWNSYLVEEFSRSNDNLRKFCTPIMQGFISVKGITINGFNFTWAIISRRSTKRAGCRLFMRGTDSDGNPANFVETEQILEYSGGKCSFVQVRGSIPLVWSQLPNIKYKPPPVPTTGSNQVDVLRKHLDHLVSTYGRPVVLINLINHTGPEKKMEEELAKNLKIISLPGVKYEAFDFHHECRKMRWDRLSILMDRIKEDIQSIGFFQFSPDASSSHGRLVQQKGIFRTNCIDSLDRTNVVQGLIAKNILETQLRNIGVLQVGESISSHQHFDHIYRNGKLTFTVRKDTFFIQILYNWTSWGQGVTDVLLVFNVFFLLIIFFLSFFSAFHFHCYSLGGQCGLHFDTIFRDWCSED